MDFQPARSLSESQFFSLNEMPFPLLDQGTTFQFTSVKPSGSFVKEELGTITIQIVLILAEARLEAHVLDFLTKLREGRSHNFEIVPCVVFLAETLQPSTGKNNRITVQVGKRAVKSLSTLVSEVKLRAGCAKYAQIWHLLAIIHPLLKSTGAISLREVFYLVKPRSEFLNVKQETVSARIEGILVCPCLNSKDVSSILGCTRRALNIVASANGKRIAPCLIVTGMAHGPIEIFMDGKWVSFQNSVWRDRG